MDNSSRSEGNNSQSNSYASLNIDELTSRLRQAFERDYERRDNRPHRRNNRGARIPNQAASPNQLNQTETNTTAGTARRTQRQLNLTGKLLIAAILIAKENNPEGSVAQIWEALVHKLRTTPLFNSENQVLQAWWQIFGTPHHPTFDYLVTGPIDEVYHKVAQLELP